MFDQIVSGLKPFLDVGFIDDISPVETVGPDAILVKAAKETLVVNVTADGIEVAHGDGIASVLSGISPAQAVRFIIQALGRKDFDVPEVIVARFQREPYPAKLTAAVIAPVGITEGTKPGVFHAVYKDAHSRFFIDQHDEGRVSLKFYHALYTKNAEWEFLKTPKLFKTDSPPVLAKSFSMLSELTAEELLTKAPIVSFAGTVTEGIPLRIASAIVPSSGVLRVGDNEFRASELGSYLMDLAMNWEQALSGKRPEAVPAPLVFSSLHADLGRFSPNKSRVEVILEFRAPVPLDYTTAADGYFADARSIVMSRVEAESLFRKLDGDSATTNEGLIKEMFEKAAADGNPIKSSNLKPVEGYKVKDSVTSAVQKATGQTFLVSTLRNADKPKQQPLDEFIKEASIPAWLVGSTVFSSIRIKK